VTTRTRNPLTTQPTIGEAWAYRARRGDPPVEVIVVRIGVRRPRRLLVRFVADDFEGRQDWVPPSRLKAAWRDLDAFIARELRWEGVAAESPAIGSAEESAAGVVFDLLVDPGLATLGYNATCGLTRIHDVEGLAGSLGLEPAELRADPPRSRRTRTSSSPGP
jgi:hypothetical protein